MTSFARTDTSIVGRWWWTVDRWLLAGIFLLMAVGALLTLAASPAVAERIGLPSFHFFKKDMIFLPLSMAVMIGVSMMSRRAVRRLATVLFAVFFILTLATLIIGPEYKGAQRWLPLGIFTLQPSEFLKPTFAIVTAWLFSLDGPAFPGNRIAAGLLVASAGMVILQPDFGQTVLICLVWVAQFFIAGLPMLTMALLGLFALGGVVAAYVILPHVASRFDRFFDPASGDTYQIDKALGAFKAGGWFGRGPGEGMVKHQLPDAHTDFVFAVLGEEYGLIACLALVALFAFVVVRGFSHLWREGDRFTVLAVSGLMVQFGLQAIINIGVNLDLIPPKGMTLPFISYGGSSLLALALGMGMVLALTRSQPDMALRRGGRR
jgi:cell division protein FtsW